MREFVAYLMKVFIVFAVIVGVLLLGIAAWLFLRPAVFCEGARFGVALLCLIGGIWIIGALVIGACLTKTGQKRKAW